MWQLSATEAAFESQTLCGAVDSNAPMNGIRRLAWAETALPDWSLLEIVAPLRRSQDVLRIEEQYVRGCDFIVDYQQVPGPNVQPQCYWRLHEQPALGSAGIETIISLRTSLLASRPESAVSSAVGEEVELLLCATDSKTFVDVPTRAASSGKKFQPGAPTTGLLVRPKSRNFSYAEFNDPSDCAELEFEPHAITKGWRWEYHLFREHLEKGVIRRGRIQCWFLPRANDEAVACQLREKFLSSPPLLTT